MENTSVVTGPGTSEQTPKSGPEGASEAEQKVNGETSNEVSFEYDGKKLSTDQIKQALDDYNTLKKVSGRQRNELGDLRREIAEIKGMVQASREPQKTEENPSYGDDFFEDPNKPFMKLEEKIGKQLDERISKFRDEQVISDATKAKAEKAWNSFYAAHPKLAEFREDLVPFVLEKVSPLIKELPVDEGFEVLAKECYKARSDLEKRFNGREDTVERNGRNISERGFGSRPETSIDKPLTSRDLLDSARQAIQKARKKIQPSYSKL